MTTLQQFSDALAEAVSTASQNIVRVEARRRLAATGIAWAGGLIVTAHHVVEKSDGIKVGLPNGETVEATLVGRDPSHDLAILRAETGLAGLPHAEAAPKVGNIVLALGRPGKAVQASMSILTGWARSGQDEILQTGVVMYPGFSGGPLIDASGRLLGMNTSAMGGGASYALPLAVINAAAAQIVQHGKVKRGFIGVSLQPVRLDESLSALTGQSKGLLIVGKEQGGPADSAGLLQGDIIVTFDGVAVKHLEALLGLLEGERVGRPVPVHLVRGGQLQEATVTVGERD